MPTARIEELLRHEGFLRNTLRGLLACEADVQDALQQTWLRVLERPGASLQAPRTWLARVARNVVLSRRRADVSRVRREEAVERGAERTPAESVARMEGFQRVVAAILELEEPYRTVVLMRYEQDLDARAISARVGRSEATVRSQLARAHEILRKRLDREFGGRERWAVLAAPLALRSSTGLVPIAAALVVAVLGGGAAFRWWNGRASDETELALAATPLPEPGASLAAPAPLALREPLAAEPDEPEPHEPARNEPAATQSTERHLPPAELLDRAHYDDYERATFSFEHGLRDDPGLAITRNDWDVLFADGCFNVRTVVDDHGLVVDLGPREPHALDGVTLDGLARAQRVPVVAGHSYFVWSRDRDTDLACLVFVRDHDVGKRCVLDWYATDGTGRAQGSLADDGAGERLVDLLVRLRGEVIGDDALLTPQALLQARMGNAGGGNQNRVYVNGDLDYIDELASAPLDLESEIASDEPARAYIEGGWIPEDRVFHVTRVVYHGRAAGDSNGGGYFKMVVGGNTIVEAEGSPDPVDGVWTGDVALVPGDEARTYLAIANSSAGEARLSGYFSVTERAGFGRPNAGFFRTEAPPPTQTKALLAPRAVLQARSGAGGGNPVRIDLLGNTSLYVDRVEPLPLDFSEPPASKDDACVYGEVGRVTESEVFVVTRVTWSGSSAGDSNGNGALKVVVAGEVLVDETDGTEPHAGAWAGRLVIVPGEESRTYLEIANSSAGDVLLTGYFQPRSE